VIGLLLVRRPLLSGAIEPPSALDTGQPYPVMYRAFSNLRPGWPLRDAPWYRYTFSDNHFAAEAPQPALLNFDPRHGV
jgi:hypothetical protein